MALPGGGGGSFDLGSTATSSAAQGGDQDRISFVGGSKTVGGNGAFTTAGVAVIAGAALVALWIWRR